MFKHLNEMRREENFLHEEIKKVQSTYYGKTISFVYKEKEIIGTIKNFHYNAGAGLKVYLEYKNLTEEEIKSLYFDLIDMFGYITLEELEALNPKFLVQDR